MEVRLEEDLFEGYVFMVVNPKQWSILEVTSYLLDDTSFKLHIHSTPRANTIDW